MKLFIILTLLAFKMFASTAFEEAYDLYKSGDFKSSLKTFETLASTQDDYDAAYILGFMYERGEGCEVDEKESQKWYKFSAHGYYWQNKRDPSRDIKKESKKLYDVLEKIDDDETQATVKQYAQSLYSVTAHNANYFLPLSYRDNGTYPQTNGHDSKNVETEFQVSLRYDFAANLLRLNEIY
jgi:phospholipase A1/A2